MFYDVLFHLETFSTNVTWPTWSMWLSMWKRHFGHRNVKSVVNISRKNRESRTTCKTSTYIFSFFQVEDIKIADTFYKIQNFLGTSWSSIIATYLIMLLSTGPFQIWNWYFLGLNRKCEQIYFKKNERAFEEEKNKIFAKKGYESSDQK